MVALYNKGFVLEKQGKFDEEIAVYDEIDRRFGNEPGVRAWIAIELFNKSTALSEQGNFDVAFIFLEEAKRRLAQDKTQSRDPNVSPEYGRPSEYD